MPFIRVSVGRSLGADEQCRIAGRLTDLMVDLMGKRREVTAVLVEAVAAEGWFIAGTGVAMLRSTPVQAEICITAGSNSDAEKASLIAATYAVLAEVVGVVPEASYVIVRELPACDWGYAGQTQAVRRLGNAGL